jgi:hypothetical protein
VRPLCWGGGRPQGRRVAQPEAQPDGPFQHAPLDSPGGVQTAPVITVSPTANGKDVVKTDFAVITLNSVLSSRWLNEARVQVGRDFEAQLQRARTEHDRDERSQLRQVAGRRSVRHLPLNRQQLLLVNVASPFAPPAGTRSARQSAAGRLAAYLPLSGGGLSV